MGEFEQFWRAYPRRVGRLDAMKAYAKARTLASAEDILAGVDAYRQHLPDEVRFIAHPTTWLNQGRWMDEYEERAPSSKLKGRIAEQYRPSRVDWFEECKAIHGGACELDRYKHELRKETDARKAGAA